MNRNSKYLPAVAAVAALATPDAGVSEFRDPYICFADYEDDEVEGSVMGERMAVVGYDDDGEPIVVGRRAARRGGLVRVRKPGWRQSQLAPGVIAPDEGMIPLPLTGASGNQFNSTTPAITFAGQIQKPFRGERLLVSTVRTGASAVGRLIAQFFVGTDLQQADVPGFDAEQVGTPNAFGVRLTVKPAQPGVFIRLVTVLNAALSGTDTIDTTVTLLGRVVH